MGWDTEEDRYDSNSKWDKWRRTNIWENSKWNEFVQDKYAKREYDVLAQFHSERKEWTFRNSQSCRRCLWRWQLCCPSVLASGPHCRTSSEWGFGCECVSGEVRIRIQADMSLSSFFSTNKLTEQVLAEKGKGTYSALCTIAKRKWSLRESATRWKFLAAELSLSLKNPTMDKSCLWDYGSEHGRWVSVCVVLKQLYKRLKGKGKSEKGCGISVFTFHFQSQ